MKSIKHIQTVSQAHTLLGLSKPKHPLVAILRFDDSYQEQDYGDLKVITDLYMVFFKEGFEGSFLYGRNTYDFNSGSMLFLSPNQVVSLGNNEEVSSVGNFALIFHPDLIRKSPLKDAIESYHYFSYDVHEGLHLSEEEKHILLDLIVKIEREINHSIDRHSQELITATMELFFKYCYRYYDRQFYTRTNINKDIVTQFEKVIKQYYQSDEPLRLGALKVKHCGELMNISPKYLSNLMKKETGKSAQEFIIDYVINKAKNNLLIPNQSISSVAYELGFEYPQHFSKLFKQKTGMSPRQYIMNDL